MAERRMFTEKIVESDAFLDMPFSARCLYYDLNMNADDDGFLNSPGKIIRQCGASQEDFQLLIEKRFILDFGNGVIVIKHWGMHNSIRKDRKKDTQYQDLLSLLTVKKDGSYTERKPSGTELTTICQPNVNQMTTNGCRRLVEDSLREDKKGKDSLICSEEGTATKNEFSTDDEIKPFRGSVFLSENQIDCLINEMGLTAFDDYVERLNDFINKNNAKIDDHFSMILKWYNEDKE